MDQENAGGQNVGDAGAASQNVPDAGAQGGDTAGAANPQDQNNGTQPDSRDEEIKTLKENIRGLNKAVIDARRAGRQGSIPTGNGEGGSPFDTEAGQYAAALELSDARLRGNIEERLGLYPELPAEEIQRIRLNPWAFASRQSFLTGDWETALDEIEGKVADRVEELAKNPTQSQGQPQPSAPVAPATVNANPAPEGEADEAEPGSAEDENLWTMPLGKLERLKNKAVAKMSQKQQ